VPGGSLFQVFFSVAQVRIADMKSVHLIFFQRIKRSSVFYPLSYQKVIRPPCLYYFIW